MMKKFCLSGVSTAAFVMAMMSGLAAQAQDQDQDQDAESEASEEVLVTATKRAVAVKDVPAAVGVISGNTLERLGYSDVSQYSRLEPSLQIETQGVGDSKMIIRGIQSGGGATVSLYLDESVITAESYQAGGGRTPDIGMYDVSRIEVLKGPQGTLFGAGAMSGSVRIITNKPELTTFSGSGSLSISDGPDSSMLQEYSLVLNLPIVENKFGVRLVGWSANGGGYIDEIRNGVLNEDSNDRETKGVRAIALWDVDSNLTLTASMTHQGQATYGSQRYMRPLGPYLNNDPASNYWDETLNLYSFVADYDLGNGSITAATSYLDRKIRWAEDTTGLANFFGLPGAYQGSVRDDRERFTGELRYASDYEGPFQFVAGIYYDKSESFYNTNIIQVPGGGMPPCRTQPECVAAGYGALNISARQVTATLDQVALFAQADYQISETLTATVGIRYFESTQHNLEYTLQTLRFPSNPVYQTNPILALDIEDEREKFSYNFALRWDATENVMLYARAASGFRQGGINDASFAANFGTLIPAGFGPDTLWNYELGLKADFFKRKVNVETAIYYIDWKDQQVPGAAGEVAFGFTTNAGTSRVIGAEFEINARPIDGLDLGFAVTYTDSELTEDQPNTPTNTQPSGRKGDRLPNVPRWSYSVRAEYTFDVFDGAEAYVRANGYYRGEAFTSFNSSDPWFAPIGDYFLVDGAIGVRIDNWDASVFVRNLTDEIPTVDIYYNRDGYRINTVPPRTFGVRLSADF